MRARIEQRRLLALPVNVHEKRSDAFEKSLRHRLAVDEDAVLSGQRKLASNDQLAVFELDPGFVKDRCDRSLGPAR